MRWSTGIGIVVGGVGGAIAALMGAPQSPAPLPAAPHSTRAVAPTTSTPAAVDSSASTLPAAAPTASAAPATTLAASASAPAPPATTLAPSAAPTASSAVAAAATAAPAPSAAVIAPPALTVPTTRDGLLKAELFCDQKKDFDECARAAAALETGSTGPADTEQAKRFRRIALTHLVAQCETGSPHACFVLAAKYRAGTELANKPASAEALEKRGAELCRLGRSAPECPTP